MPLRQYDPAIARWTSIDPVTHHSMSTYTAFDNNPVYWADPSGADSWTYIEDGVYRNNQTGEETTDWQRATNETKEHVGEGNDCCGGADAIPESLSEWFGSLFNYFVTSNEEYEQREFRRESFNRGAEKAIEIAETELALTVDIATLPLGGFGKVQGARTVLYSSKTLKTLKSTEIGAQSAEKVASIAKAMKNGDPWVMSEPIYTYTYKGATYILDGHHRIKAAQSIGKGIEAIEVSVTFAKQKFGNLIDQIHKGLF